jgi:transposase
MDHAPIHAGEEFEGVKALLKDSDNVDIEFLPKCSPFLNLIELTFNVLKAYVRGLTLNSRAELVDAIKTGIEEKNRLSKLREVFQPL